MALKTKPQSIITRNSTIVDYVRWDGMSTHSESSAIAQAKWNDTKDGSYLPNWKALLRDHHDATTGATSTRMIIEAGTGSAKTVRYRSNISGIPSRWEQTTTQYWGSPPASFLQSGNVAAESASMDPSTANNSALSQFYEKARNAQSPFQIGVAGGELKETLQLLSSPMKSIRNYLTSYLHDLRRIKKARRKGRKPLVDVAADTWLETAFAIKPLMGDVANLYQALQEPSMTGYVYIRGHSKDEKLISDTSSNQLIGGSGFRYRQLVKESVEITYRGEVRVKPFGDGHLAQRLGGGIDNFLPTVWELIPYSFLVDYFSNVGSIINAYSFVSSGIAWMNKTVVREVTRTETFTLAPGVFYPPQADISTSEAGGFSPSVKKYRTTSRHRLSDYPLPSLVFKIPGVGSLKWANIAALGVTHRHLLPFR